jgi:hypothetical protein
MSWKKATFIVLFVLVLIFMLVAWIISRSTASPKPEVFLQVRAAPAHAGASLSFDVINKGQSSIMCPDTWGLEFADGTVQMLSLPATGNIRVSPAGTGSITISIPTNKLPWRLVANYYVEDLGFEAKVLVDRSPLKGALPPSASRVQGKVAVSDWFE